MRKQLLIKRDRDLENRRKARENMFMKAEMYYSPYSTLKPTAEVKQYFSDALSDGFKSVIVSVRNAEKLKEQNIKRQMEENARREQELQKQNKSISFSFPTINQLESESESDNDFEQEVKDNIELNFDGSDNERKAGIWLSYKTRTKALQQDPHL